MSFILRSLRALNNHFKTYNMKVLTQTTYFFLFFFVFVAFMSCSKDVNVEIDESKLNTDEKLSLWSSYFLKKNDQKVDIALASDFCELSLGRLHKTKYSLNTKTVDSIMFLVDRVEQYDQKSLAALSKVVYEKTKQVYEENDIIGIDVALYQFTNTNFVICRPFVLEDEQMENRSTMNCNYTQSHRFDMNPWCAANASATEQMMNKFNDNRCYTTPIPPTPFPSQENYGWIYRCAPNPSTYSKACQDADDCFDKAGTPFLDPNQCSGNLCKNGGTALCDQICNLLYIGPDNYYMWTGGQFDFCIPPATMNLNQQKLGQLAQKIIDLQMFSIDNTWSIHKAYIRSNYQSSNARYHYSVIEYMKWDYTGGPGPM